VCAEGREILLGVGGEGRRLRWWYMDDRLHTPIWNRNKKNLCNCCKWSGEGLMGQCK
jgi:hypothetical protein